MGQSAGQRQLATSETFMGVTVTATAVTLKAGGGRGERGELLEVWQGVE